MANLGGEKITELKNKAQAIELVQNLRFVFYIYALLCFLFWVLNCFEFDWLHHFTNLFILPYKIVTKFYNPQGSFLDFTLAIIGLISFVIGEIIKFCLGLYLKFLIIQINKEEKKYKEKQRRLREQRRRKEAAKPHEEQIPTQAFGPVQNPKLIFLISPHINKIKNSPEELELTFQEVETWKQRANKKLIDNVIYSKPLQKGYYRKNLFLVYQDFNYVEEFVYYIKPTIDSIVLEFRKYKISVSFTYVMSALQLIHNLEKELDCMDTVLSLGFMNEFIATNRFKINYDNKSICKYALELKGEYNLSKNLSISNRQPLFTLTDKKSKGE